jgi:AmiR/NasT family two-component response regulator
VEDERDAAVEQALRSSRTIGAAMGMIMPTQQVAEDEAFAILSSASQQSNRKVRELAADLVQRATSSDQLHP